MLYLIIALFAAAAIAGLIIASFVFKKKETPKPVVYIHGGLAALGLVLLCYLALSTSSLWYSAILFAVAAVGGFYMLYRDLGGKPGKVSLVIIHALVAVAGFAVLLWTTLF